MEWDPFNTPILTEVTRHARAARHRGRRDDPRGVIDEVTGLARRVIIEDQEGKLQPRVSVKEAAREPVAGAVPDDALGETRGRYMLPVGAHLLVADGQEVFQGDIIAKIPRETTKTKDITGGLPRVAELFEARKPKEQAVITEIDGAVEFAGFVKGMRKIVIRADDGETKEYLIPRGKHIAVHEGDRVKAGEALMDGSPEPARLPGRPRRPGAAALPRERGAGGVPPAGRDHQRQAHRDHRPPDAAAGADRGGRAAPTSWSGELVDKFVFQEENDKATAAGKPPATAKPVLLGITKASLSTDSFISAASFQETTRVLTEAAISGKTDDLRGLKENVIVGRLIPAGTGLSNYTRAEVVSQGGDEQAVEVAVAPRSRSSDGEADEIAQAG